jgi:hypothetical protein
VYHCHVRADVEGCSSCDSHDLRGEHTQQQRNDDRRHKQFSDRNDGDWKWSLCYCGGCGSQ